MLIKRKVGSYYFGRNTVFRKLKVDLCVSEMSGLVVILFSVRNVRDGFIVVVMVCLGR